MGIKIIRNIHVTNNNMYTIQKQFIPGNDSIWVQQLTPEDEIFTFETEAEAQAKADELTSADTEGRLYRVASV
jgi:hypothetical protein